MVQFIDCHAPFPPFPGFLFLPIGIQSWPPICLVETDLLQARAPQHHPLCTGFVATVGVYSRAVRRAVSH
jgi:hypothetical protein